MKCFNHQKTSAVCACGVCFKGLCNDCMQPIDDKFVCSTVCAERLQKITKLNNYAMSVYGIDKSNGSKKVGMRTAMLHFALGITFIGFGAYSAVHFGDWGLTCFTAVSGLIFVVQAYKTYKRGLRL